MVPDWMLERYRLGELDEASLAMVRAALETDATLQARLTALDADSRATFAAHPTARIVAAVKSRAAASARPRASWAMLAWPLAVAAGVAVWIATKSDDVLLKGNSELVELYRRTPNGSERLHDGSRVHAHDVVQLKLGPATTGHVVIASYDGAGGTTLHFPLEGATTAIPEAARPMPNAFELDDAPGFERFIFVQSERPLDPSAIMLRVAELAHAASASKAPLPVVDGQTWNSARLDKEPK